MTRIIADPHSHLICIPNQFPQFPTQWHYLIHKKTKGSSRINCPEGRSLPIGQELFLELIQKLKVPQDVLVEFHLLGGTIAVFRVERSLLLPSLRWTIAFDHLELGRKNVFGYDAATLTLCAGEYWQFELIPLCGLYLPLRCQKIALKSSFTLTAILFSIFLTQRYSFLNIRLMFLQQRSFDRLPTLLFILPKDW